MAFTRDSYINEPHPIESELRSIFDTQKSLVIFDIGSCEGEDSIRCSRIFPNARIFAVEALPNNLALIKANLDKYAVNNVEVLPFALSNETGTCNFYVSSGQPEDSEKDRDWDYGNKSSSLLPPNKHLEIVPWVKFQNTINVETKTLNNVCVEKNIASIDFIHMDVQGAELKVLIGADELIKKIRVIWLEVEAIELYENQPLKQEVEKFMRDKNFRKIKDTVDDISGDHLYINLDYLSNKIIFVKFTASSYLQHIKNTIKQVIKTILNRK
jgi:FkbM family methyltransferase